MDVSFKCQAYLNVFEVKILLAEHVLFYWGFNSQKTVTLGYLRRGTRKNPNEIAFIEED